MAYILEGDVITSSDNIKLSWDDIEKIQVTQDYISVLTYDLIGYFRINPVNFGYRQKRVRVNRVEFEDGLVTKTANHWLINHRWCKPADGNIVKYYNPKKKSIEESKIFSVKTVGFEQAYEISGIVGLIVNNVPSYA